MGRNHPDTLKTALTALQSLREALDGMELPPERLNAAHALLDDLHALLKAPQGTTEPLGILTRQQPPQRQNPRGRGWQAGFR